MSNVNETMVAMHKEIERDRFRQKIFGYLKETYEKDQSITLHAYELEYVMDAINYFEEGNK